MFLNFILLHKRRNSNLIFSYFITRFIFKHSFSFVYYFFIAFFCYFFFSAFFAFDFSAYFEFRFFLLFFASIFFRFLGAVSIFLFHLKSRFSWWKIQNFYKSLLVFKLNTFNINYVIIIFIYDEVKY